ncbi:MAG: hypothetical protein IKY18_06715 [Oscillospiraceae bacterium]|nr:hypothetical protein [Oscillospiraceae bacterium]
MKKILCMLMCAALLLAMPMSAFAADCPYSANGESVISKRVYSTCTISIPSIIELENPETWSIMVSDANVAIGETIKVKITNLNENNAISLTHPNSDNVFNVQFTAQDGTEVTQYSPYLARITSSSISEDGTAGASFGVSVQGDTDIAKAGIYEGRMQYEVIIDEYWE